MLKTSSIELAEPRKGVVGAGDDSKVGRDRSKTVNNEDDDEVHDKVNDKVEKKSRNPSKSKNLFKFKKMESDFFTSGARMASTVLKQAFIKAPILHHYDPERHIRVETNAFEKNNSG